MKKRYLIVILVLSLSLIVVGCQKENYTSVGETFELTYEYDDLEREYILYLPEGVYKDAPLIFVLHGYTSRAQIIMDYSDFKDLADEHDFVLCYPQGLEDNMGVNHWNANLTMSDVDDIGFITALADELVDEYALDDNRVFTCGMSNGGFMSYTLAMHANDTFRAMASMSGIMSGYEWEHRHEALPIPVLHVHGTADSVVLPDGSMTTFGGWGGAPSVSEIVEFWAELNETDEVEVEELSDLTTAYYYRDGIDGNEVWYYEIEGYGHEWPIKDANADFSGTELIWEFFSQYQ